MFTFQTVNRRHECSQEAEKRIGYLRPAGEPAPGLLPERLRVSRLPARQQPEAEGGGGGGGRRAEGRRHRALLDVPGQEGAGEHPHPLHAQSR